MNSKDWLVEIASEISGRIGGAMIIAGGILGFREDWWDLRINLVLAWLAPTIIRIASATKLIADRLDFSLAMGETWINQATQSKLRLDSLLDRNPKTIESTIRRGRTRMWARDQRGTCRISLWEVYLDSPPPYGWLYQEKIIIVTNWKNWLFLILIQTPSWRRQDRSIRLYTLINLSLSSLYVHCQV